MAAKVDATPFSVLVWCVLCPTFSELVRDVEAGHALAVAHETKLHPGCRDAAVNQLKWRRRHA